jgi:hypothetical protein
MAGDMAANRVEKVTADEVLPQRWQAKFGQVDKWSFCLRAAQNAADQERQ